MGKSKDLATGASYVDTSGDTMSGDLTIDTNTFHVDVADNRVGIGTTAPTNKVTIIDGGATPYGSDAPILLDMKRNTANTDAANAVALRLANNSNGFRISYGGTSDTLNISGGSGNTVATFRNDGGMTLPYQPAFSVSATGGSKSSGVTIIGSTAAQSPSIITNVGSHFATGTGRFTAPVAGTYFFSGFANFSTSSGGPAIRFIKNGSATISQNNYVYGVSYNGAAVSCVAVLAASDYVYLECNHYNHVTSTIYTSGVCGYLIG